MEEINFTEDERSKMLAMSPWEFDQSPNGWRKFEKTEENLKAAELIRAYIAKNKEWILNPKAGERKLGMRTINFHVAQVLALEGPSYYAEAIEACNQSFDANHECWNAYVSATIGFLEGDIDKVGDALQTIEQSQEYKDDPRSGNPNIVKDFKKALESGERNYKKVYLGK